MAGGGDYRGGGDCREEEEDAGEEEEGGDGTFGLFCKIRQEILEDPYRLDCVEIAFSHLNRKLVQNHLVQPVVCDME
jgi:hypothetical protein